MEDFVRALARVRFDAPPGHPGAKLDAEKAIALAIAIYAGQEGGDRASFDFVDFMSNQDAATISFTSFLEKLYVPTTGPWKPSEAEMERCKAAWEAGQRPDGSMARAKIERRTKGEKKSRSALQAGDTYDAAIVSPAADAI